MMLNRAKGLIDRRFQLIILDVPSLLGAPPESARHLCRRVEHLLDLEVRIVLVASGGGEPAQEACRTIGGLSRVFLFGWSTKGEVVGFNQWGRPVQLTKGVIENPEAAAAMILDVVAVPAEIGPSQVLVIGEHFGPGGRDLAFAGKAYAGARLIALTEAEDLPPQVHKAPPGLDTALALLDTLLWIWQ